MELKEVMQISAWCLLGLTIVYAHFQMRKLRKIVFNHMLHRFQPQKGEKRCLRKKLLSLFSHLRS